MTTGGKGAKIGSVMMNKVTGNAKRKTTPLNASGGVEHGNEGTAVISLAGLSG
jgi:hypothetical protein